MEIHTVKRAVIMAAGIGKRMQPLTYEVPKPLVDVNGIRMIDTIIGALHYNGIYEIYVVVGYKKELFWEWALHIQGVVLIENPYYDKGNNMTSLYVVRDHLEDSIILDGDQIIYNPAILGREFYRSGYNVVWCEGRTEEWLLEVVEGKICSCSRSGGEHGWQLYSISRWSSKDAKQLKRQVEIEFDRENWQIYWDDIVLFLYFEKYELGTYVMKSTDLIEIDGVDELSSIDPRYRKYCINKKEVKDVRK